MTRHLFIFFKSNSMQRHPSELFAVYKLCSAGIVVHIAIKVHSFKPGT